MSHLDHLLALTHSFEQYLGNPSSQNTPVNFQQSLLHDEQDSLDWAQVKFVQQWGFMEYLIPKSLGGKMESLESAYLLVKALARRDLTIANSLGLTCFAGFPVWLAGSIELKSKLIAHIRQGNISAFALTEEEHGSDLTANELRAIKGEDSWYLSGRKWCVNFATMGKTVTLLARTHEKGGLLGFSLFFLDKTEFASGFSFLPKLLTHGVRGLDISGFTLDNLQVPAQALIGQEQKGLELTYKTFQLSRTLCASLSLGGADTALRMTLSFAQQRQLYGNAVFAIPVVRQRLGEQFTQLLVADCVALVGVKACTVMPKNMSLWSAIVKFLVPKMSENIVEQCSIVMGARGYLRSTEWAMIQKIRRDVPVVGLFDGSSQVNLAIIATNLLPQASKRGSNEAVCMTKLAQIFSLQQAAPDFGQDELSLFTHQEDDIIAGLNKLDTAEIKPLIQAIHSALQQFDQQVLTLHESKQFDPKSFTAFRLAEQYCWLFAASCCIHFWYFNQAASDLQWLRLSVQLILNQLGGNLMIESELQDYMGYQLQQFAKLNQMFSVIPTQLAE